MKSKALFCLLLAWCTAGCSLKYTVEVNSFKYGNATTPSFSRKRYVVLPQKMQEKDVIFEEFEQYVVNALNSKGYVNVTSDTNALDIRVFLEYGVSDREVHYTRFFPVWGQTGGYSANTQGTFQEDYGGKSSYSGKTVYTPNEGIVGSVPVSGVKTVYEHFARLTAFDMTTGSPVRLWQTNITTVRNHGDLRRVFPVLIAAAIPYLGESTKQIIKVGLREKDSAVMTVKEGKNNWF